MDILYDLVRNVCINDLNIYRDNIIDIYCVPFTSDITTCRIHVKISGKAKLYDFYRCENGYKINISYLTDTSTSSHTIGFTVSIIDKLGSCDSVD